MTNDFEALMERVARRGVPADARKRGRRQLAAMGGLSLQHLYNLKHGRVDSVSDVVVARLAQGWTVPKGTVVAALKSARMVRAAALKATKAKRAAARAAS